MGDHTQRALSVAGQPKWIGVLLTTYLLTDLLTYLLTTYSPTHCLLTHLLRAALLGRLVQGAQWLELGHRPLRWEPVHELDQGRGA